MSEKTIGYIINESAIPGFQETNIINQDKKGRLIAETKCQTADELNRNQRIYPEAELFPQLTCPRTRELLESGYMRGEMGHPLSNELVRQQTIDDTRTCVQFLKFWTEGKDVWARYRGTNNAFGKAINDDLADGCKPAFSLRALGNLVKTPRGSEVHNLRMITYDCVIYPSHPGAYTQRVLSSVNESAMLSEEKPHLQIAAEAANLNYYYDVLQLHSEDKVVPFYNSSVINYVKSESANFKFLKECFDFAYDTINLNEDGSRVSLKTKDGDTIVVNLEKYIQNDIMEYCDFMNHITNPDINA